MCANDNEISDSNNNYYIDMLFFIIKFITNKNRNLNLNVCKSNSIRKTYIKDNDIFFKAGQLLLFLYVFSIKNLSKKNIEYYDGTFFIDLSNADFNFEPCLKSDSKDIAYDIINKSTYTKESFPEEFDIESLKCSGNLNYFENGFKMCYKAFLKEKFNIIKFLESRCINHICFNLIRNIKLLNPRDMEVQLQLIRLKFKTPLVINSTIRKIESVKANKTEFVSLSRELLDIMIKNSIIGMNSSGSIQITWIGYIDRVLRPIGIESIYIAIYFYYIGMTTKNEYYSKSAQYVLKSMVNLKSVDYEKIIQDNEILKAIYLLNRYIDCMELNDFIKYYENIFKRVSSAYKEECKSNGNILILECIFNRSLNMIKSVILV